MGEASGNLTVDGDTVDLKWAYAIKALDSFDETKKITVIILSDRAIEEDPFPNKVQLMFMGIQQKFKGITAEVDSTGKLTGLTTIANKHAQFSGTLPTNADSLKITGDLLEGKLVSNDEKHAFDIAFKMLITQLPTCSEMFSVDKDTWGKLPPDGGEPGKVFKIFDNGFNNKDAEMVKSAVCPETAKDISPQMFEGPSGRPTDIKVTCGYIKGDKALVIGEGVSVIMPGEKERIEVYMSKTDSGWKVVKQRSGKILTKKKMGFKP